MNNAIRIARAEAQALATKLKLEREKAVQDYNVMIGKLDDPSEDDEDE